MSEAKFEDDPLECHCTFKIQRTPQDAEKICRRHHHQISRDGLCYFFKTTINVLYYTHALLIVN